MRFLFLFLITLSALAQEPVVVLVPEAVPSAPFSRILILGEINLLGFEWKDIGLERVSQFTAPLLKNWEKWLKEQRPKSVGEIKVCEAEWLADHSKSEEKLPE